MARTHAAVVRKSKFLPAPRERVFRAWIDEQELSAWWRPGGYRVERATLDLRAGGLYEICMANQSGQRQRLSGEFIVIEPPERLVMTWRLEGSPDDDGYAALLTVELTEVSGGTQINLTHERLRTGGFERFDSGWEALLSVLAAHLGARRETLV